MQQMEPLSSTLFCHLWKKREAQYSELSCLYYVFVSLCSIHFMQDDGNSPSDNLSTITDCYIAVVPAVFSWKTPILKSLYCNSLL